MLVYQRVPHGLFHPGASADWRSIQADGPLFHAGRFAATDGGEATSNQARCLKQTGEESDVGYISVGLVAER